MQYKCEFSQQGGGQPLPGKTMLGGLWDGWIVVLYISHLGIETETETETEERIIHNKRNSFAQMLRTKLSFSHRIIDQDISHAFQTLASFVLLTDEILIFFLLY